MLVTGASGFIGSFLCEEGLKHGCTVWAGMRRRSSRRYLQNEWLQFVELDMTDRTVLERQLSAAVHSASSAYFASTIAR